ncbi:MAG: TolB family protein [Acidimicrobiia bacterium]
MPGPRRFRMGQSGCSQLSATIALRLCLAGIVASVMSCAKNPTQPVPRSYPDIYLVDASPVWSRDGQLIAFRRVAFSTYGPPGIYVVPSSGGPVRHVAPGDIFWPVNVRFSPDGERLVFAYQDLQLYVADIRTGVLSRLMFTSNGANYPDWSPDGRYIVYSRASFTQTDSAGIHYYDLTTGVDHLVRADRFFPNGLDILFGHNALWSPDSDQFAFLHQRPDGHDVALINRDGTGYRRIFRSPRGSFLADLHWYVRPSRGIEGLTFTQISGDARAGPYYVSRDGSTLTRFKYAGLHRGFSPDGEWIVETGVDDSVSVIFVQRVDDLTGASRRQLTYWNPPVNWPTSSPLNMGLRLPRSEAQAIRK